MNKIIEIIKKFINKAKSNKIQLIEDKTIYDSQRDKFVKSIHTNKDTELIDLQKKLEHNQISINDINIFTVMDLIDKYQEQINELNRKIQNC